MIFIETSIFSRMIYKYITDDEYSNLQNMLFMNPSTGKMIRGTGGLRKLRWAKQGRGKSGGIRIIYYWNKNESEIWLLTVYGKNERDSISSHILNKIAEVLKNG